MIGLYNYRRKFSAQFARYNDERYENIAKLFDVYTSRPNATAFVSDEKFIEYLEYVLPVIAVKDYKSQSAFPVTYVGTIIRNACELKNIKGYPKVDDQKFKTIFVNIVSEGREKQRAEKEKVSKKTGFELPTVSALFHFCFPDRFPIVDRYVAAACKHLKQNDDQQELLNVALSIPGYDSPSDKKWDRYQNFIKFLAKVLELQNNRVKKYPWHIRDVDMALMVLGKELEDRKKKK